MSSVGSAAVVILSILWGPSAAHPGDNPNAPVTQSAVAAAAPQGTSLDQLRQRASARPGDLAAAFDFAFAALQGAEDLPDEMMDEARTSLTRLVEKTPGEAKAEHWAVAGALNGRLGRLEDAEKYLRRALDLAPDRVSAALELVDVLIAREQLAEAGRVLDGAGKGAAKDGTDLSPWRDRLAAERERATVRADLARAAGLDPQTLAPAPGTRTGRWAMPPEYRKRLPGEERLHGLLDRVECGRAGATILVRTAEGPVLLTARALVEVQVVSYREDFEPLVSCGARRQGLAPVFVTWRPGRGTGEAKGTIVALEFLGSEYLPRR